MKAKKYASTDTVFLCDESVALIRLIGKKDNNSLII